jgi:tRNA dimethylallyltransferase
MNVLAVFGPTAVGKTGVAVEVARLLRERGEDPVAVNCDSIQVYRGLEVLSGAANAEERAELEHSLLSFIDPAEEFSAGRYAELAHAEIDALLSEGRRPILVGGTGLYLRAALCELELRPPVPAAIRDDVEGQMEARGPEELHAELSPALAEGVHPNDRKRIARLVELQRAGIDPPSGSEQLWTAAMRHPGELIGLIVDRDELARRIDARVDAMVAAGAVDEVRTLNERGASRTARAAIGFSELLAGDAEAAKAAQRRYARRQLTWMRKMPDVALVDRAGRDDAEIAAEIVAVLG